MATDPLALAAEVKALTTRAREHGEDRDRGPAAEPGLVQSLITEYGLGMEPRLRRALYDRLARLERQHGQTVEILIAEARSLARAPEVARKGNYFARAICLKLREAGIV